MSKNNERARLGWACLFLPKNRDKKQILEELHSDLVGNEAILGRLDSERQFLRTEEEFFQAWKIVLLDAAINETDFSQMVLTAGEYEKAKDLFRRKQYKHVTIQKLLGKIYYLLRLDFNASIQDTFKARFEQELENLRAEKVGKEFRLLKLRVDEITSGVKSICYLQGNLLYSNIQSYPILENELNEYLKAKYGYDFNAIYLCNSSKELNNLLQRALLDDESFWEKHSEFRVAFFLNAVYKLNDKKRAEKILNFIFENILKLPYAKEIVEKNLSFYFLDKEKVLLQAEKDTAEFIFAICERRYFEQGKDACVFCYPALCEKGIEQKIARGREFLEKVVLKRLYETRAQTVFRWFIDTCGETQPVGISNSDLAFKDYLDCATFKYRAPKEKSAFTIYDKDFFSKENIWARFCLKAYAVWCAVKDEEKAIGVFYERFYSVFNICEKKLQLTACYKRDISVRERIFQEIRKKLQAFGVEISEEKKADYIISMLDRKVATFEEAERFPVLEQLGDSIYGLAVAELRFFDMERFRALYEEELKNDKKFDDWVCAATQVKIAKKYGLHELYFSASSVVSAYTESPEEDYRYSTEKSENYYADALEILLGAICKDLGFEKALEICKRMIKETYPKAFGEEIRWEQKSSVENSFEPYIVQTYFETILPAPYSRSLDREYFRYQEILSAFAKFMLTYILGTEKAETRTFLSQITWGFVKKNFGDKIADSYSFNDIQFDYFHCGLQCIVEKYRARILKTYEEIEK